MKKTIFKGSAFITLLAPALAFAQAGPNFNYINSWLVNGLYYLRLAVTVIMILMTIFFLWSALKLVMNKKPDEAGKLRQNMLNGLLGLFIAVAVWGIIRLAGSITGVDTSNSGINNVNITCPPGLIPVNGTCVAPGNTFLNQS